MKKFMSIFGAALFVFALTSCANVTTESTEEGADDASTEESTEVTTDATEETAEVEETEAEAEVTE